LFGNVFELKNNGVRTILKEHDMNRLISIISLCDAAGVSEQESMDLINGGALGYKRINHIKREKVREPSPLKISRATYYKYKKKVRSLEFQKEYLYRCAGEGFLNKIYRVAIMLEELIHRSLKNLLLESDPLKNQQIINGITRNISYYTDFDSILKKMIEKNRIPTLEDYRGLGKDFTENMSNDENSNLKK